MKGIFRFSLCLGILYDISIFVFMPKASALILSFSFEVKDSATGPWKSSNDIVKGTHTRLNCITLTGSSTSATVHIKKVNEPEPLKPLMHSRGQIVYEFGNITCDKMGTYVCENGQGSSRNLDLGILKCEPQLCRGETKQHTLIAPGNEVKTLSLCIFAYPEINGVELVTNASRDIIKTANADSKIEPQTFATYSLQISLTCLPNVYYREQSFSIMLTHGTQMKKYILDYTVILKCFSPPDCPTDILMIKPGPNNATLAWQPGLGKGLDQLFYIYKSTDNITWQNMGDTNENSRTITGLVEGAHYAFRIISGNRFMKTINENLCRNTVYYKAGETPLVNEGSLPTTLATTEDPDSGTFPNTAVWVAIVVVLLNIILVGIIIAVVLYIKRGILRRSVQNRQYDYPTDSRSSYVTQNTDSLMNEYSVNGHIYTEAR